MRADMLWKIVNAQYSIAMGTRSARHRSVVKLHTLGRTCSSFKCLRKVVEMIIGKGSSRHCCRTLGITNRRLSLTSKSSGDLRSSLRTMSVSNSRNIGRPSAGVLTRSETTGILSTISAKGIECSQHFSLISSGSHFSKKPVADKMLTGSKRDKVGIIIATTKTLWNDVMSFSISFRKGGLSMFNNDVVPSCVFV